MSELTLPRTPSPQILGPPIDTMGQLNGDLTPPLSSQLPPNSSKALHQHFQLGSREHSLASPPPTVGPTPTLASGGLFGEIPSTENVDNMDETQLRNLVSGMLLPALGEARMAAAHYKLQHNLLSIENTEFMQRAAVEQEMTYREIQVLQDCAQGHHEGKGVSKSPRSPKALAQKNLDLALKRCQILQKENLALEKRLQKAKKLISQRDAHIDDLEDRVQHLRHRIRQNRDHFNALRASGTASVGNTPATKAPGYRQTPKTPAHGLTPQDIRPGSQNAFDALLIAGEVMSGEAASVPSTPTLSRPRATRQAHLRGAHSLSSLQTTPAQVRPTTAESIYHSPSDRLLAHTEQRSSRNHGKPSEEDRARYDRDSTISVSDHEEAYGELHDDVPASQASQTATSMLRQSMISQRSSGTASQQDAPSLQTRITGNVRKPGLQTSYSSRKHEAEHEYGHSPRSHKRAKLDHTSPVRVGLGIDNIPSPTKRI